MKETKARRIALISEFSKGWKLSFVLAVVFALCNTVFFSFVPQIVRITVDSVIGTNPFDVPGFIVDFLESLGGRDYLKTH